MLIKTFFQITSQDNKINSVRYANTEYNQAKARLIEMARANVGVKFHLMKHVSSVIANDIIFEDSCE